MARIVFVDSQRDDLAGVRALLANDNHVVEVYRDGKFALEIFQRRMPDLVVINLPICKLYGAGLVDRIRTQSTIPIVLVSTGGDEIDEIMSLRAGADAYIRLPMSPRLLGERIKTLLRRHAMTLQHFQAIAETDKMLVCGDLVMDPGRHDVVFQDQPVTMTSTEFRLLQALVSLPGRVKSREQMISIGYPNETDVSDRTIDSHIKRIRKKLKALDPNFSCIETLYGIGYRYTMSNERAIKLPKQSAAWIGADTRIDQDLRTGGTYLRAAPWYTDISLAVSSRPTDLYQVLVGSTDLGSGLAVHDWVEVLP